MIATLARCPKHFNYRAPLADEVCPPYINPDGRTRRKPTTLRVMEALEACSKPVTRQHLCEALDLSVKTMKGALGKLTTSGRILGIKEIGGYYYRLAVYESEQEALCA